MNNQKTTKSSGNIFKDMGLANSEERLVKAELAYQINRLIQKKGLTQKEIAQSLGVDQPKISALKQGRLSGFSIERLFRLLALLNQDIEIIIKPHNKRKLKKHTIPHIQVKYATS